MCTAHSEGNTTTNSSAPGAQASLSAALHKAGNNSCTNSYSWEWRFSHMYTSSSLKVTTMATLALSQVSTSNSKKALIKQQFAKGSKYTLLYTPGGTTNMPKLHV